MTTALAEHPLRDATIERWLAERHVAFTFDPELALDAVDQAASISNQARLEPLNPEVVDRYTADVERGDVFPPIVVLDRGKRKAVIVGGNHRHRAHVNAGRPSIPAYVITAEPEMVLRLTYEDNRRHGLPPSEAERITQGVHLVASGWTNKDAADCVGVSEPVLSVACSTAKADRRAAQLGVDRRFALLAKATRYAIGKLQSDPVFAAVAQLAVDAQMPVGRAQALVKHLQQARSEADALAMVGDETEELRRSIQKTAGTKQRETPRSRARRSMTGLTLVDPHELAAATPPEARREMRGRIDETIAHLEACKKALR